MMLVLSLISFVASTFRPDHAVSLGVVAPWYGVPLFEQFVAFFTDYSYDSAKLFIKDILSSGNIENEDYIWKYAHSVLLPQDFAMLKGKIEIGFYLPRTELYRETSKDLCGTNYPDLFGIGENLNDVYIVEKDLQIYDFDLVIGNHVKTAIYANLHNSTVSKIVLDMIENDKSFALRPIGRTDKYGIPLRGFGIEMRPFKYSMEYGVKDSIVLDSAKNNSNINLKDKTINDFGKIPNSYVDVKNIDNFGERFAGFVSKKIADGDNLIHLLRDLSGNFPLYMENITESDPDEVAYEKVAHIIQPGYSFSVLNGRIIRLNNLDLFTLLDIITEEKNFRQILEGNFKLSSKKIDDLSSLKLKDSSDFILRVDSDLINYYNDLEKDSQYSKWGNTIQDLKMGFERLPEIRKNLANLILVLDPSTPKGLSELISISYLINDMFPLRLGILPFFNLGNLLSRKVAYAYHHLAKINGKLAIQFLIDTFKYCGVNKETRSLKPINENHFASAYKNIAKNLKGCLDWSDLHNLYDDESDESKNIQKVKDYILSLGIKRSAMLLNGKEISLDMYGIQALIYEVQRIYRYMDNVIYQQKIKTLDEVDCYKLLSYGNTIVSQLNSKILFDSVLSIGITHKTLAQQSLFLDYLRDMEWNYSDEGRTSSFYILLSKNQEEIDNFAKFAKQKHLLSSCFAVNPTIPNAIKNIIGYDESETLLIANGRVFKSFTYQELELIDIWCKGFIYGPLEPYLNNIKYKRTELTMFMSCAIADWRDNTIKRRFIDPDIWNINSKLVYSNSNDTMYWDLLVNPFTREFQRIADMIEFVNSNKIINVRLVAIPPEKLEEPIQTYYRNAITEDNAVFTMLNDTTTYSSMPDMPDSWIFESMKASVDLDNILLKELKPSTHEGIYILTNIKAEGICEDEEGNFAEGAELALFDNRNNRKCDTIVMMSNGYWQLASNPGVWQVDLGGSRSKLIYEMKTKQIIVSSFSQKINKLNVQVNPGMKGMKVYNITAKDTSNSTRVDVFSVASGHLYERLLKIMMLAVRRQSKYNVKFWIIKAFLSPQFKATLPIMAQKYNFTYQLVSYKWPSWLYPQYEKQRIIWGNKILFLDVLFPLDLERVIYIDSDQIVRTDLIELMRMDFKGAPYAFTPMCNTRVETEPYRFWKRGYWHDHLKGKKYHISALFAIDLARFRQMAAGDWLRLHYQQLSPDPNSLANLDQDLPNYAQDHIPIYTLPQNWLWCETWCSDETMDEAKTIDLCNNPLTKRPKLEIAQTRVKEWPGLDEEARNISAGPNDYEKFFFPEK